MSFFAKFLTGSLVGGGSVLLSLLDAPGTRDTLRLGRICIARMLTPYPHARSLTLYYQNEIRRTTDSLSTDLRHLSDQLVRAVPVAQPSVAPPVAQGPVIPQRLPFTEELKARVRPLVLSRRRALFSSSS